MFGGYNFESDIKKGKIAENYVSFLIRKNTEGILDIVENNNSDQNKEKYDGQSKRFNNQKRFC